MRVIKTANGRLVTPATFYAHLATLFALASDLAGSGFDTTETAKSAMLHLEADDECPDDLWITVEEIASGTLVPDDQALWWLDARTVAIEVAARDSQP